MLARKVGRLQVLLVTLLVLASCVPGFHFSHRARVVGISFSATGADSPSPARDVLGATAGIVEFGAQRGRLDVHSTAGRDVSIGGVVITRPLARVGDYYLFDSAGFVLVRPRERTFSVFSFSRSWIHIGSARDPSEGFMELLGFRADTLHPAAADSLLQHGPFTVRWHLDRRRTGNPPIDVLSRGWIDVADAPAGEASAIRWFGAAAALSALSVASDSLSGADLQITAAVVLPRGRIAPLNLIVLHPLRGAARMEIDAARFVLPSGFKETPWPGFERAGQMPASEAVVDRWRRMPVPTPNE